MVPKITLVVSSFLPLFMLTNSIPVMQVWKVPYDGPSIKIPHNLQTKLDHKNAYIFLEITFNICQIIYWVGVQVKPNHKLRVADFTARSIKIIYELLPEASIFIARATSKPNINNFQDLEADNLFETIPRLYKVTGADTIRQVQLNCNLLKEAASFLLDNSISVAVYHSPLTSQKQKDIAYSLADYIMNVENGGDYEYDFTHNSSTEGKVFCDKILDAAKVYFKNKTDSPQNNHVGSFKTVNKKFKRKLNTANNTDNETFEKMKEKVYETLKKQMLSTQTDSLHSDRILSSSTASSSTVSTRTKSVKKCKAGKGKTTAIVTKNNSFLENAFGREPKSGTSTTSMATVSESNENENLIPIFMGSKECAPKTQPPLIETLKSECVYILKDLENNELIIYLGKYMSFEYHKLALETAEIDLIQNPSLKLTIIFDADTVPTNFMIQIESEVKKYLIRK